MQARAGGGRRGGDGAIGAIVMLDRVGKGIRTSPRDALISLSTAARAHWGSRSECTARWTRRVRCSDRSSRSGSSRSRPLAFGSVFLVSFCIAVVGLGVIVLLVPRRAGADRRGPRPSCADRRGTADRAALPGTRGRRVVARRRDDQRRVPVPRAPAPPRAAADDVPAAVRGGSLAYMLLAVPLGRLADRVGRGRVFLAGYARCCPSTGRCSRRPGASSGWRSRWRSWARPTRRPTACWRRSARRRSTRTCARAGSPSSPPRRTSRASSGRWASARSGRSPAWRRRCLAGGVALVRGDLHEPGAVRAFGRARSCDRRTVAFVALLSACAAGAGVDGRAAVAGNREPVAAQRGAAAAMRPPRTRAAVPRLPLARPRPGDRQLRRAGRRARATARVRRGGMSCERVYAVASAGICIARKQSLTASYEARILGPDLRVRHTVKLAGVPSRARVSPTAAMARRPRSSAGTRTPEPGQFSTETALYDMRRGRRIADVERFAVHGRRPPHRRRRREPVGRHVRRARLGPLLRDACDPRRHAPRRGQRARAPGACDPRQRRVPVAVAGRHAHRLQEARRQGPGGLALPRARPRTGRETPLAEERPIDDQLEWLDDDNLLYRAAGTSWTVRADGSGTAREYLAAADSPAVVR